MNASAIDFLESKDDETAESFLGADQSAESFLGERNPPPSLRSGRIPQDQIDAGRSTLPGTFGRLTDDPFLGLPDFSKRNEFGTVPEDRALEEAVGETGAKVVSGLTTGIEEVVEGTFTKETAIVVGGLAGVTAIAPPVGIAAAVVLGVKGFAESWGRASVAMERGDIEAAAREIAPALVDLGMMGPMKYARDSTFGNTPAQMPGLLKTRTESFLPRSSYKEFIEQEAALGPVIKNAQEAALPKTAEALKEVFPDAPKPILVSDLPKAAAAEPSAATVAAAQKMPFEVDEQLVMHSPHSGEDTIVSYRGKPENGKAMIWSGKMQYAVPESWLRRQGEKHEGQIQPVVEIPSVAKVETPLPAASEVRTELQPTSRLSKTELIDELSGQEPSYFEGKMNWKNSRKGLAKNTKQELVDMVDSDRKSKAEFEILKSETSKVYPEIDEMAKAAGNTWKTAIRERAEKEGVAVPNLQNERSDAVYALSQNIASRRIRAAKPTPPPAATEVKSEAPKAKTPRPKTPAQEFDDLVAIHGEQEGWGFDLETTDFRKANAQGPQSGSSVQGMKRQWEMKKAATIRAMSDIGGKASEISAKDKAAMLPKLKEYLEKQAEERSRSDNDIPEGAKYKPSGPDDPFAETADVAQAQIPKLRSGEKQGDVFAKQIEDFALVGEKGTDVAKAEAAKAKAARDAAEAKAIQDKQQQELVGMGAAVPEEFEPSFRTSTGIKKAAIEEARAERGVEPIEQPAREPQPEVLERVKTKVDEDPGYLDLLVGELEVEPRPINADEVLSLDMRYVELQTERAKAMRAGDQAAKDGRIDDVASAQEQVQMWEQKLGDFERMVRKSGTLWGRTGAMMQRRMRADFSLEAMEQRRRADKGFEPLTPDERAEVKKAFDDITLKNKVFQERVTKLETDKSEAEARAVMAEIKAKSVPEFHPSVLSYAEKFVTRMEKTADKFSKELFGATWSPTPEMLAKAAFIGAARLARGIVEVGKWTESMVGQLGEKFRPYATQVFDAAKKVLDEELAKLGPSSGISKAVKRPVESLERETDITGKIAAKIEGGKDADISPLVNQLARVFVERGIKELDPLLTAIHDVLVKLSPEITRREAMDALSGYGKYTLPKQDVVSRIVSDLKGQALETGKLLDLESKQPLKKTGFLRGRMSDARRRLVAKVNEYKRKFGVTVSDPATQLASALDARKTYYRNQISDLEAQIKSRQKFIKTRTPSPSDSELQTMMNRRDVLKGEFDEIFGKPKMTPEQRLKQAIAVAERTELDWNTRLDNAKKGKFGPLKESGDKISSPELQSIQARTEAVREQVKELRDLANPKKSAEEIALQSLITRMKTRTADFLEKTVSGEFAPKAKREPLDISKDREAMRAAAALKTAQNAFEQGREKYRLANRTKKQIAADAVMETANLLRNQITSLDVSAPGRQGFWLSVGNPLRALRAGKEMFRTVLSQEKAMQIEAGISTRPNAGLYKKAGLRIVDLNETRFTRQEEVTRGRWANRVPWIRASNRAFVTYLNVLRADSFDAMWKSLPDKSPEAAKALAEGINDMTGFGSFGKASHMADAASTILWSPRLLASRFHILTGRSLRQGPADVRKAFAVEYAKTLGGIAALYALGKMAGGTVETDSRSSDFGKLVFGNTRLDPLAGLSQVTVLVSRLISGETKSIKGKVIPIRGKDVPFKGNTGWDVASDFLRTKLRPELGAIVDLSSGKNLIGDPVTAKSMATNFLVPLTFRDIQEVMEEQGIPAGVALEILSLFGMGLQNFETNKTK